MAETFTPAFCCCFNRPLPPHLELAAAWLAALARPAANAAFLDVAYGHPPREPLPVEAITMLRSKAWPNGFTLRVAFVGGTDANNASVLSYMQKWSQYANIDFVMVGTGSPCDIRVAYRAGGYWSNIGIDCGVLAAAGEVTMNLEGFDRIERISEEECNRVICHEAGHALSMMHEMLRPDIQDKLDYAAVISWGLRTQGWPETQTASQFFPDVNMADTVASPTADPTSIGMYAIPAGLFKDKTKSIVGGTHINDTDALWMAKLYPGRWTPHPEIMSVLRGL